MMEELYPRKDSCGINNDKVEVRLAEDLVVYHGLWPAHGGGKSGGDDGNGFLSTSTLGFEYHGDTYPS